MDFHAAVHHTNFFLSIPHRRDSSSGKTTCRYGSTRCARCWGTTRSPPYRARATRYEIAASIVPGLIKLLQ